MTLLASPSEAPPCRQANNAHYLADCTPAHRVGLQLVDRLEGLSATNEITEASDPMTRPHCLQWGTRESLIRGGRRLLNSRDGFITRNIESCLFWKNTLTLHIMAHARSWKIMAPHFLSRVLRRRTFGEALEAENAMLSRTANVPSGRPAWMGLYDNTLLPLSTPCCQDQFACCSFEMSGTHWAMADNRLEFVSNKGILVEPRNTSPLQVVVWRYPGLLPGDMKVLQLSRRSARGRGICPFRGHIPKSTRRRLGQAGNV